MAELVGCNKVLFLLHRKNNWILIFFWLKKNESFDFRLSKRKRDWDWPLDKREI